MTVPGRARAAGVAGAAQGPAPLRGPIAGSRLAAFGALGGLAAIAWVVTARRMGGMDMGPWTDPGTLGFYTGTWMVMMAAMMLPSIAPMVAIYAALQRGRNRKGMPAPAGATPCFVGGYLLTWGIAGLAAYGLLAAIRTSGALSWDGGGRWVAAGVLLAAAVYELTPLKGACLTRCRGPLAFVVSSWRDGRLGALRMGALHGAWCTGCCWALMASLFALGVMSLAWMALVALLIAGEKLLPWRPAATGAVAGVLVLLAVGVAVAPDRVPGLTLPM